MTGVHASIVAQRLGYGEDGGEFAQFDDGNSNFEDCEEENEVIQERLWKEDDEMNGETIISIEGNRDEQGVRLLDHGYEVRVTLMLSSTQNMILHILILVETTFDRVSHVAAELANSGDKV